MKQLTENTAFHLGIAIARAEAAAILDRYAYFVLICSKDEEPFIDNYINTYKNLFLKRS